MADIPNRPEYQSDLFKRGLEVRREVLGADYVDASLARADDFTWRDGVIGLLPFLILVAVVVGWTGPWSDLTKTVVFKDTVKTLSAITHKPSAVDFTFNPMIAGTAILASWILICLYLRVRPRQLAQAFRDSFQQIWGALLVGLFIFGLAYVFNVSGMAGSMAFGFSKVGTVFIVLAPILGWIAVALSGSNTASNAVFAARALRPLTSLAAFRSFAVVLIPAALRRAAAPSSHP